MSAQIAAPVQLDVVIVERLVRFVGDAISARLSRIGTFLLNNIVRMVRITAGLLSLALLCINYVGLPYYFSTVGHKDLLLTILVSIGVFSTGICGAILLNFVMGSQRDPNELLVEWVRHQKLSPSERQALYVEIQKATIKRTRTPPGGSS